jgi:hypothetical protein
VREQGNYQLLKGDSVLAMIAFNDDRSESDLSYGDDSELNAKFPGHKIRVFSPGNSSLQNDIRAVNMGLQLWKVCLILTLLFIAAEILLIRFYNMPGPKLVTN